MTAFLRTGAILRNQPNSCQNSAIWPFIESRIAHAFYTLGLTDDAARTFETMMNRKGCNEWYSPQTGEPKGGDGQLWSAASILDAKSALS